MWIDQRGSEVLARAECLRLVAVAAAAGAVGRVAVSGEGAPLVQPVSFAYANGQVVVRVGDGLLWRRATGRLVAFEVDGTGGSACGPLAWSVVVRGLAWRLDEDALGTPSAGPVPLVPAPGDRFLAIRADVVTGRRFRPRASVDAADMRPGATSVAGRSR